MKNLLRLEELAQFLVCLGLLIGVHAPWWCYPLLFIGPDISMLGYLVSAKVGAVCYNAFHHKAVGIVAGLAIPLCVDLIGYGGLWSDTARYEFIILGIILYGHASMDRIFGYGLKFGDNFHHTHLGWIGGKKVASGESEVGQ